MKRTVTGIGALIVSAGICQAIPIAPFVNTEDFVERARDIVVAKCLAVHDDQPKDDDLYAADVEIVSVFKGDKKAGKAKIATIYPMAKGKTYMLTSLGGSALGTDFLAIPQRSVVEIPAGFQLDSLKRKTVLGKVEAIFDAEKKAKEEKRRQKEEKPSDKAKEK